METALLYFVIMLLNRFLNYYVRRRRTKENPAPVHFPTTVEVSSRSPGHPLRRPLQSLYQATQSMLHRRRWVNSSRDQTPPSQDLRLIIASGPPTPAASEQPLKRSLKKSHHTSPFSIFLIIILLFIILWLLSICNT